MECSVKPAMVDREDLRAAIKDKYTAVADTPEQGFHFHTGRPLARMLGYDLREVDRLPPATVASFAGMGNPFAMGRLQPGETVVDVGCGAGFDTLQAALQVGAAGRVIAVDMTDAMLRSTSAGVAALGLTNVEAREGYMEQLPVDDATADVIISNGVINLAPDKVAALEEMRRALKPGGRVQIADIVVHRPVPQDAKDDIDLWSG